MKIDKQFISDNLLRSDDVLNPHKLKLITETIEELYLIYNECGPKKCYCGNKIKFNNFVQGYTQNHCSIKCAHNNKKMNTLNKQYIKDNLIRKNGQLESGKSKYFSESITEIYNIFHNCAESHCYCGEKTKLKSFVHGYNKYCSRKCMYNNRRNELAKSGKAVPITELSDFEYYHRQVWIETRKQPIHELKNYSKRGRADLSIDAYHLDHMFSIYAGFKYSVPVYIVGNIYNLKMIPFKDNCSKQNHCSITVNEILKNINRR